MIKGGKRMNNYGQYDSDQSTWNYDVEEPLTMGQWLLTLLVLAIPCVNLIMLFVWGFGVGNKSRQNFCRAYLVWYIILMVAAVLLFSAVGTATLSPLSGRTL